MRCSYYFVLLCCKRWRDFFLPCILDARQLLLASLFKDHYSITLIISYLRMRLMRMVVCRSLIEAASRSFEGVSKDQFSLASPS
jgi:hypothetical protein